MCYKEGISNDVLCDAITILHGFGFTTYALSVIFELSETIIEELDYSE